MCLGRAFSVKSIHSTCDCIAPRGFLPDVLFPDRFLTEPRQGVRAESQRAKQIECQVGVNHPLPDCARRHAKPQQHPLARVTNWLSLYHPIEIANVT